MSDGLSAEEPLRRQVVMAYRIAREAVLTYETTIDVAEAIYFEVHPEVVTDRLAASARVNEVIASAINVDPLWLSKNLRARYAMADVTVREAGRPP